MKKFFHTLIMIYEAFGEAREMQRKYSAKYHTISE